METTTMQAVSATPVPIKAMPLSANDIELQYPITKIKAISDIPSSRYQGMWCFYLVDKDWYIGNREKIQLIFPSFATLQMDSPFIRGPAATSDDTKVANMFLSHYVILPIWKFFKQSSYYNYTNILLPAFVGSNINNRGIRRQGLKIITSYIKMLDLSVDGIFVPVTKNLFTHGIEQESNADVVEMIEATQLYLTEHINTMLMGLGMGEDA